MLCHHRQITRECVYLVRRDHVLSHEKDGGYTIRFAVAETPTIHANFTALSSMEPELLPIEVLHCAFRAFCSRDLDLDPMTFIYELDAYPLKLYPQTNNELSRLSQVIVLRTYRQTYTNIQCHRYYYHPASRVA